MSYKLIIVILGLIGLLSTDNDTLATAYKKVCGTYIIRVLKKNSNQTPENKFIVCIQNRVIISSDFM